MKRFLMAAVLGWNVLGAHAVDIGISAADALAKVQQADSKVLFVDVRDPVEVMFVGLLAERRFTLENENEPGQDVPG